MRLGEILDRLNFYRQAVTPLSFGPFRLEPQKRQVMLTTTGEIVRLTEKESALLANLAESDKPLAREDLLAAVWDYDARIDTRTLETHIYQLRRKLDPDGKGTEWILHEDGGYRLRRA